MSKGEDNTLKVLYLIAQNTSNQNAVYLDGGFINGKYKEISKSQAVNLIKKLEKNLVIYQTEQKDIYKVVKSTFANWFYLSIRRKRPKKDECLK